MVTITVSIVTHNSPLPKLDDALGSLKLCRIPLKIVIVDNASHDYYRSQLHGIDGVTLIESEENRGFGAGHNLGFKHAGRESEFFLVVNPDIIVHAGAIEEMAAYMKAHPHIGLLAPKIVDEQGEVQLLCKREPTVLALLGRWLRLQKLPKIKQCMDAYTMADCNYDTTLEPEFISGCFMLFRSRVFENIGGFDERFFLYFEDTDITRRVKQVARAVYFPSAVVTHAWQGGARKNLRLTLIMMKSAWCYFRKWGWQWW